MADSTRKKLIAGNWKMFKTPSEAEKLGRELYSSLSNVQECDILICPPYVCLDRVKTAIADSAIRLGAQDIHWEKQGPRTGKISGDMLSDLGVSHVIIGHSEQRTHFHESDETVNKKTRAALSYGLIPVICLGETKEERESGQVEAVISRQMKAGLQNISAEEAGKCVIAYEPVWAIGTGLTASPAQVQEAHLLIRNLFARLYDTKISAALRILYGGSLKPENADTLFSCQDVDGGLIGGASLETSAFCGIVNSAL